MRCNAGWDIVVLITTRGMFMKKVIIAAAVLSMASVGAFAQSYTSGPVVSSIPPKVKHGAPNAAASLFSYEAASVSRYTQLGLLTQVDSMLKGKHPKVSAKKRAMIESTLALVALSGTEVRAKSAGSFTINNFPLLRVKACHTIGQLGGPQAQSVLLQVLHYDRDPLVLAEAAYELGRLKRNPHDIVSNAIAAALRRTMIYPSDGQFAYSALNAFSQLAKAGHLKADPSVYLAISNIGDMSPAYAVRKAATATLQTLATYG